MKLVFASLMMIATVAGSSVASAAMPPAGRPSRETEIRPGGWHRGPGWMRWQHRRYCLTHPWAWTCRRHYR